MPPNAATICLLDDEPSVLKALGRLLASEGLQTEKFSEPARLLDHARRHVVHLAVIDLHMPRMTGFEVLAVLRAMSPETRVIMMTGENYAAHRTAALEGGASAFFLKPFDDEEFLAAVRKITGTTD